MEGEAQILTHEDNQAFLQLLRENMELLGMEETKVEVRFEEVSVEADVRAADHRALPTLLNSTVNIAQDDTCSRSTWFWENNLLKSTGCREVGSFLEGKVMYNEEEICSSTPCYLRAYVSQHDLHHAEMTVRETINFSSQMLGTNNTFEMLVEAIRKQNGNNKAEQYIELFTKATSYGARSGLAINYIIKILGLSECADTIIGDDLRRGISGGQKKRVTIGEMLVGFSKCFFMDDISTGLDSSTTFDIMKFLQQMAHTLELTMVISLLQPPPETFELFDDIILLCEGQIVYHGPRENAIDFFGGIGFKCSSRKNVADFLQEVTSKMDQKQYWAETSLWTCLTYYAIGYASSPIRFFQQLLVLFAMHQMSMGLYRLLASVGRTKVMSNMLGTTVLIAIYILGGFVISKDELQIWLHWGYWASPFTYAQNAISMNEFLDKRWAKEFHYVNANTIGEAILKIRGLLIDWRWYWICVNILFGFSVVFNILSIFALEFLNPPYKHKVINIRKVNADYINQISGDSKASTNQMILPFQPFSIVFKHINYFVDMPKAIPGVPRIREGQNPAAWMLDISSQATEYRIGLDYAQIYHVSSLYKQNMLLVDELNKPEQHKENIYFPPGLFMLLSFLYYTVFAMVTVALTPNVEIAAALSFLIFILWNVFSGFIILKEADPAAWTVYGLTFSQLGERTEVIRVSGRADVTVREYLEGYMGLHDGHLPLMVALHLAAATLFAALFCVCIKHLRFQRR
ncbi:hypothetical protein ABZP36_029895 [Zizania latifolia]